MQDWEDEEGKGITISYRSKGARFDKGMLITDDEHDYLRVKSVAKPGKNISLSNDKRGWVDKSSIRID